jgi:hypothetical protein
MRAAIQQMLAVVQDQQNLPRLQMRAQQLSRRRASSFGHAERLCDRSRDQRGITDRGKFGEPHAITISVDDLGGGLHRQPGLADTARAGDRDQPLPRKEPLDLDHLTLAPDE